MTPEYLQRRLEDVCLAASREIARSRVEGVRLEGQNDAHQYLQDALMGEEREVFVCLWLAGNFRVIEMERHALGTINAATIHPREVVKSALAHNAGAVVFAHNHPSGTAMPSSADVELTMALTAALELVGVRVLEHIVVTPDQTRSCPIIRPKDFNDIMMRIAQCPDSPQAFQSR